MAKYWESIKTRTICNAMERSRSNLQQIDFIPMVAVQRCCKGDFIAIRMPIRRPVDSIIICQLCFHTASYIDHIDLQIIAALPIGPKNDLCSIGGEERPPIVYTLHICEQMLVRAVCIHNIEVHAA